MSTMGNGWEVFRNVREPIVGEGFAYKGARFSFLSSEGHHGFSFHYWRDRTWHDVHRPVLPISNGDWATLHLHDGQPQRWVVSYRREIAEGESAISALEECERRAEQKKGKQ